MNNLNAALGIRPSFEFQGEELILLNLGSALLELLDIPIGPNKLTSQKVCVFAYEPDTSCSGEI